MKTVLITQEYKLNHAYIVSRPFLLLTPPLQQVGLGWARSWEETQLGQLTKGMMSHSAIKAMGKKEERTLFRVMVFAFPNNYYAW